MHSKPVEDLEVELQRLRAMQEETTDPMAARLLFDIVEEMEAEIRASKSEGDS